MEFSQNIIGKKNYRLCYHLLHKKAYRSCRESGGFQVPDCGRTASQDGIEIQILPITRDVDNVHFTDPQRDTEQDVGFHERGREEGGISREGRVSNERGE